MSFNEFVNRVKYTLIYFICRNKESPIPLIETLHFTLLTMLIFLLREILCILGLPIPGMYIFLRGRMISFRNALREQTLIFMLKH